jgi:2-phospho-L-lactate guanylyltransferase
MFTIIPAKPFDQSKTRLATALSAQERINLSQSLLHRTITLARQVGEVVVISSDAAVRRLAKQAGAWTLIEAEPGLNQALRQATTWVMMRASEAVLIVPGDLPLLRVSDLKTIIAAGQQTPAVVIAPCHHFEGTNALLLRPPTLFDFAFGSNSFTKHQQAARSAGLEPVIYQSPTVALDLDWPEDLKHLQNRLSQLISASTPGSAHRPR